MLGFLIFGLWASEIFNRNGRSRRIGLALGLAFHFVGFVLSVAIITIATPYEQNERKPTKRAWLLLGFIILISVLLIWVGNQLSWNWEYLGIVALWALVISQLLFAWAKQETRVLANLPLAFWLIMGLGAAIAMLAFGIDSADKGAYVAAWVWILVEPLWAFLWRVING